MHGEIPFCTIHNVPVPPPAHIVLQIIVHISKKPDFLNKFSFSPPYICFGRDVTGSHPFFFIVSSSYCHFPQKRRRSQLRNKLNMPHTSRVQCQREIV